MNIRIFPLPGRFLALLALPLLLGAAESPATARQVPERVLAAPFGSGEGQVAGGDEDTSRVTDGFPPAFALGPGGRIHVLDAGNGRVMADDGKGGLRTLFHVATLEDGLLPALRDLAVFPSGVVALADATRNVVRLVGQDGTPRGMIEGFPARELGMTTDGRLIARHAQTRSVVAFRETGELATTFEGTELHAVAGPGGTVLGAHEGTVGVELLAAAPGGEVEAVVAARGGGTDEVMCDLRPLGCDAKGNLYLSMLYERDLDPARGTHAYRMTIARIEPRAGGGGREIEVEPFRGESALVTPRQFVVAPDGSVLTYGIEGREYLLRRYVF